ncbi:putative glucan endo-1,3-beta-glucosidase GVI [Populus trichocarpa]|uniref:putative glucan endo-1,3-beta-glucosidase GVI n=1 Tax=Populus trichocarpa TaxID=3694 RepID=UPI002279D8DF|nr:putative glucan endo-1,3-beta-glucosidase GVI [Populus trichocarpa]
MARLIFHIIMVFIFFTELHRFAEAQGIGVSYPRNIADNLPKAKDVVALCKSHNVRRIRLHDPRHDVLQALKITGIKVILGVGNDDIMRLATDARFARTWVLIREAQKTVNLSVPVSSVMHSLVMATTFPPSSAYFDAPVLPIVLPIVQSLQTHRYPLLDSALLNTGKDVIVKDLGEEYTNIFDAQVDAAYSALEKADALNVEILNYMCSSVI